ncbi:MAG: oligoendopeptidase F family protein [Bacilli bacterium]|nr:oligoendopeptidase F family protein [Bacilli bacterium]
MQKYSSRKDVPEKYKWDLTEYYKDEKDYDDNFNKCLKMVSDLKNYVGCTSDASRLYEFLKKDIETYGLCEDLYVYSFLVNDQELGNSKSMERISKIENLFGEYSKNVSFFSPELLKLDKDKYDKLFKDNSELSEFKDSLDKIYRDKDHVISEREEKIVTDLVTAMDHFSDMSSTMLNSEHDYGKVSVSGEEEKITTTNFRRLMKNSDRKFRQEVREKYNKTLSNYAVSSAQFLDGYVKGNIASSRIHNYKDAWEAKLFNLNMPNEAYEMLVKTTEENLDVLHEYYRVFKESVKLDKLYQYDLYLDASKSNKEYSIEEAQELCLKAISPLGEDYQKLFKKIFEKRYIDYAQYPGKCSGGYSASSIINDSRILMSYNYDLESVSTIIHEGGHNVHHQMVNGNNLAQNREISNLMAEVASLTNECLLSSYLAKNGTSLSEKKAGIDNILGVFVSNLFGAVREGKMEQDFYNYVSNGGSITKDYMNELTRKSLEKYYGKEVELDEYSNNSWMVRSHYYMNYYLYNYAFCISVASYVASEILDGNKDMLKKYMKYLTTGSDVWPIDAFKILDVDLTKKDVYEKAIKYFASLLDEFKSMIEGE